MSLFRNEAIEAKRLRLWGEVRLAQPPSLTIWTVVLTLLCAVLATTLIFGRYTRKETVPGFLIPEAGVVQVRTVQSGRIARVLVRDGQAVAEGAPLIEFTSDIASIGQGPMLDVQLAETGHQEASLESRRAAGISSVKSRSDALIASCFEYSAFASTCQLSRDTPPSAV